MAIIQLKRKKGNVYKVVLRVDGQYLTKTFRRKIDAQKFERDTLTKRDKGELTSESLAKGLTLDGLREKVIKEYAAFRQSLSTLTMESRTYDLYVKPYLGEKELSEIIKGDFQKLFNYLIQEIGLSTVRVNRVRQILCVMYNQAIDWEIVENNLVSSIKPLPQKNYEKDEAVRFITKDEAKIFLDHLKVNDLWIYPKVLVLINTGIRYGEMRGLLVKDFIENNDFGQLIIQRSYCKYLKKIKDRAAHRMANPSEQEELIFIEVQTGYYFGEDDIVRLKDDYGRAQPKRKPEPTA